MASVTSLVDSVPAVTKVWRYFFNPSVRDCHRLVDSLVFCRIKV